MRLPKHLMESDLDMNEVDDRETSDMIDENCEYWDALMLSEQNEIAEWWADNYDQYTEGFFDDVELHEELGCERYAVEWITETELIQYLTEEGYIIR